MCLAIPMEVVEIDWPNARCQAGGIERQVSLQLLEDEGVAIGDHVIVHVGYAIEKVAEEDAAMTHRLFAELDSA